MKDRHKVRICVSVVHLLSDEIKNLGGTFGVYMYLEQKKYIIANYFTVTKNVIIISGK